MSLGLIMWIAAVFPRSAIGAKPVVRTVTKDHHELHEGQKKHVVRRVAVGVKANAEMYNHVALHETYTDLVETKAPTWEIIQHTMGAGQFKIFSGSYRKPESMSLDDFLEDCKQRCAVTVGAETCSGFCATGDKAFFYSSAESLVSSRQAWTFYKKAHTSLIEKNSKDNDEDISAVALDMPASGWSCTVTTYTKDHCSGGAVGTYSLSWSSSQEWSWGGGNQENLPMSANVQGACLKVEFFDEGEHAGYGDNQWFYGTGCVNFKYDIEEDLGGLKIWGNPTPQPTLPPTPRPTATPTPSPTLSPTPSPTPSPSWSPPSQPCQVTVYEHWPEGITAGVAGLEAAEQAWGGSFPTGASMVLHGTGDHPLAALSNLTSSVKVQGACCKAYGYTAADCSGTQGSPIEATTKLLQGLPAGVVTPATGLAPVWGCNDCAQCVKVTQQCP